MKVGASGRSVLATRPSEAATSQTWQTLQCMHSPLSFPLRLSSHVNSLCVLAMWCGRYGMLSAMRDMTTLADLRKNVPQLDAWYNRMVEAVGVSSRVVTAPAAGAE